MKRATSAPTKQIQAVLRLSGRPLALGSIGRNRSLYGLTALIGARQLYVVCQRWNQGTQARISSGRVKSLDFLRLQAISAASSAARMVWRFTLPVSPHRPRLHPTQVRVSTSFTYLTTPKAYYRNFGDRHAPASATSAIFSNVSDHHPQKLHRGLRD